MVSRPCGNPFQGLSLLPRTSRNLLSKHPSSSPQHWISSTTNRFPPQTGDTDQLAVTKSETEYEEGQFHDEHDAGTALAPKLGDPSLEATSNRQVPPLRHIFKHIAKTRTPSPSAKPFISPAIQHPSRRVSHNTLRKQVAASRRLSLHEYMGEELGKSKETWVSTLRFMLKHTPKYREVSHFRIAVEKAAISSTHPALRDFEAKVWELRRKHECKVRIEPMAPDDESMILNLSGVDISIRDFFSELVRLVGKLSAVKILDSVFETQTVRGQANALFEYVNTNLTGEYEYRRRSPYELTQRADQIPRPAVWTKDTFEQYVADLISGRVPPHMNQALYPAGSADHQSTVVGILVQLLTSDDLQTFISPAAIKMALSYVHRCGPRFLPEARTIFYRAELRRLVDAETFQSALANASNAGNLRAFYSTLCAMCARGHYIGAGAWRAFLIMIKDPITKLSVMKMMRSRRLHLLPSILGELGRQMAIVSLQDPNNRSKDIKSLLSVVDRIHGTAWLNTIALNQMLGLLGAQGNLAACDELLQYAEINGRVRPDHYTLNIMMTHTRRIRDKTALLSRWPELRPDAISYQLLFSTAWDRQLPNMLGVVWRYSVFAGLTSSKMRHTVTMLLQPRSDSSKKARAFKAWEDAIFGRDELAAGRRLHSPETFGAWSLIKQYMKDAGERRPLIGLGPKLQEAYEMDMKIIELGRKGGEAVSSENNLIIEIPLGAPGEGIISSVAESSA